jgi:gamma-glutamylcyclotransferase (GGCT)/AIG2-like uncharacterized protein YtfP
MPEPTAHSTSANATERLFFVYGTLRQTGDNDITRLLPEPRYIGTASIKGVMVHLGGYPGVSLGGDGDIIGEVYAVSAELEATLDAIESEYPAQSDEYVKRSITVLVNGQSLVCSVYEINPRYAMGKPCIASGDWIRDR